MAESQVQRSNAGVEAGASVIGAITSIFEGVGVGKYVEGSIDKAGNKTIEAATGEQPDAKTGTQMNNTGKDSSLPGIHNNVPVTMDKLGTGSGIQ